jgi:capsular polysaccharide transport system permease protein
MAIPANNALLFHRPVRAIDILLTRILMEVAGASISFSGLSVFWIAIGWASPPEDVLLVLAGWVLLIWFGAALALIVGAATAITEIAERLWHPIGYIMFPLSGAIFMVDWLGEGFRQAALWVPIVHCVELIRKGFFGSSVATHYDVEYVVFSCLIMTVIGLALVRIASRQVKFG